ncbi:MAG: acyl-CoA dehydrogenase family protein [Acidimicrobiales bacterium]
MVDDQDDDDLFVAAFLDPDHSEIIAAADWAAKYLVRRDSFDRSVWSTAAEGGYLGIHMPLHVGGSGASPVRALMAFEGLGRGADDFGMVFSLASQLFATQSAIVEGGTPEQISQWLPPLVSGDKIMAFAMSEPDAGSDTGSITTTALPHGDRYRIAGTKTWTTLAPVADEALVFANTDPSKGRWGITAFRVPLDLPGVVVGKPIEKMGMGSCPFGEIHFDDVEVGPEAVLGAVGAGQRIFAAAVEIERAFLYAAQLGRMRRLVDLMIERSRQREQFGKPIGQYQGVSHRIVDAMAELEAARLLVYKAAALYERRRPIGMASALAKLRVSEKAVEVAVSAMRVFGAEGYVTEVGIESEIRDALAGLAYSGTSEIQKNIVAGLAAIGRPVRRASRGE